MKEERVLTIDDLFNGIYEVPTPKASKPKTPNRRINDLLMTVQEVAIFAKLSVSKIYHDAEAGRIPVKRWGKREIGSKPTLRFKKSEILRWLDMGCPNAREFEAKLANLSLTGLP